MSVQVYLKEVASSSEKHLNFHLAFVFLDIVKVELYTRPQTRLTLHSQHLVRNVLYHSVQHVVFT